MTNDIKTPKIYAIVVTHNGGKWIDKCFSSLLNSSISLTVIAVDNASTDDTVRRIREGFPNVKIIGLNENLGFGKANNIGLRAAINDNVDYVFLLNQDARIEEDTVQTLVAVAERNNEYGILSPFHYNWEGDKIDHFFLRMINIDDCPQFLSDVFLNKQREVYSLKFIHAACWMVSKDCLAKTGGFDPLFYHYGEDNDYINRVVINGFKVGICPSVNVFHYGFFDPSKPHHANKHLVKVSCLLELKTLQNSLLGNYLFFFKRRIDQATNYVLARKFSKAFKEMISPFVFLKYYKRLARAREASREKQPFL